MNKNREEETISSNKSNHLPEILRTTILLLFSCISTNYATNSFSQEITFTFHEKTASIKDICKEIEQKSDFIFIFSDNAEMASSKKVNLTSQSASVAEILDKILSSTGLAYSIIDKQIVIYAKNDPSPDLRESSPGTPAISDGHSLQQPPSRITLSGRVVDETALPLPGVNIFLKSDKTRGTTSDTDGNFTITVPPSPGESLIFSFIGMINQEIALSPSMDRNLKIILKADKTELNEVVVTGIFNKAKESFTGAVTTISVDELQEVGNRSILSSIRNIDPSFNILQDITLGSNPNALPSITIRGSSSLTTDVRDLQEDNKNLRDANQPLFVMDGFEISLSRFMDLDENQIQTITLLKDNSATSLYGSRGANGVVVITSKLPEEGKLRITYRGSLAMEAPDLASYNLLNAREKLEYEKAAGLYFSINANQEQELLDLYNRRKIDAERGVDTYWIGYPVRVGVGQKHSLRLEGGDQSIRYAAGISYNNIAGTMKGSGHNAFNGNVFLQYRLEGFIFQNDLQITQSRGQESPYGTFQSFAQINAYWTPYDADGNIQKVLEDFYYASMKKNNKVYNPLYDALLPQRNLSKTQLITNNFSLEWNLNDDLFLRGRLSISSQHNRSDRYLSAKDTSFDGYTGDDYNRRGRYTYGTGESSSYKGDLTLNYSKLLADKHQLFAGLGYNIEEEKSEYYSILAEGFSNVNMDFLGMAGQYFKDGSPSGAEGISRRVGVVFTGNYTYDNRYYVDVSASGEGSSKFGSNRRFAPFWSTGGGWNIHHESFLKEHPLINIARVRFSFGISGSQKFNPYQAFTTFKDYSSNNYRSWNGVYLMGMGNPDLGWQTTSQLNVGTDLELFQDRFRLNVDLYDKTTNDLLADINLPTSSGFSSYKANVGKVSNRGFEVSANLFLIRDRRLGLSWSVGGSIIHNRNKIMEISNSLQFLNKQMREQSNFNPSFMFQEGESINTIYAVRSKGIDPSNGKEIYVKQDGTETYTWDSNDKVACGVNEPKYLGVLNTTLRYKGFNLNAIFGYRYGGQMYNYTLINKVENIRPSDNADKRVLRDRWKQPGDVVFFKSVSDFSETYATSRFVMDENTLDLRTLSLGYELPTAWVKKHLFLEYLSVTGYGEDLFYISTVKQERGLSYPYSKKFSFAITARF